MNRKNYGNILALENSQQGIDDLAQPGPEILAAVTRDENDASVAVSCPQTVPPAEKVRIGVHEVPPFLLAAMRFFTAGVVLYAWLRLKGTPAPTRRRR